ncbi:MAG: hypothetical protein AAF789_06725 [Bacteroidota bacterium]
MKLIKHSGRAVACLITAACSLVFEEDISSDQVVLLAPSDNVTIDTSAVTMQWDAVFGAVDYQIRVVSPSFDSIQQVVLDSFTVDTQIAIGSLEEGRYQWEVRALNGAYSTDFFFRSFFVDLSETGDSSSFSAMSVELLAPGNDLVLDSGEISFWWETLGDADTYELAIVRPSFAAVKEVITVMTGEENLVAFVLDSGNYEWGVRAINANSVQTERSVRTLRVERR